MKPIDLISRSIAGAALSILIVCGAASCSDNKKNTDSAQERSARKSGKNSGESLKVAEVTVTEAVETVFDHELVSNGKVTGHEQADLWFKGDDVITAVYVHNGQSVRKGQKLATLDSFKVSSDLAKGRTALAKAELELQDALIGQGYDPQNLKAVPEEVMRLARLRSGYTDAEEQIRTLTRDLEQTVMTAPFDGTIANLTARPFNRPDGSKPAMRIIGRNMDVEFTVLENELSVVRQGDPVDITPFSTGETFRGRIANINPVVDENGLVKVTATTSASKGLYDGMNVRVSVRKNMGRQLVVPKSAVVLRTGRQVVFTLSDDGKKALWNYVHTGLENMTQYTVTEGLQPGARVIVSGNMDLAHESPVKVKAQ